MKRIIAIVLGVVLVVAVGVVCFTMGRLGAVQEGNITTENFEGHSSSGAVLTEEAYEAVDEGYDYNKILEGDFSQFAGEWENDKGYTVSLKNNGTEGNGTDYYTVAEDIECTNGYYNWAVVEYAYADGESWGGYAIWLYPVGVEIVDEYTGEIVPSDTNQVRLYAGQDFYPSPESIYYKQ